MNDDFDSWLSEREKEAPAGDGGMLRPGQRIGAYRIVRQLGVGGMGQVYEAEHVALGVRRALKVFSTESEHSEFLRKRFVAEGRILADLQHPRIVRVYDLVVDEDSGMAYFEMDLVLSPDGQPRTLADELQDGPDEERIVGWFKDICEGLAYIHSQGVVHRDISLDNILIGRDGRAVITDFGIAKIIDDSYRKKIDVTVTMVYKDGSEVRIGKERYMAPELKKPNGRASFATDAWALGVLLFRMLSGSWYDVGTRLEDWHADLKYDWHPVLLRLFNPEPKSRLGNGGIAALPTLLNRRARFVPFGRKWIIACGVVVALSIVAIGVSRLIRKDNVQNPPTEEEPHRPVDDILKGAEAGRTEDMVLAAEMYRDGKGVETDYTKSVELYRKAIGQGSFDAVGGIGSMYEHGWGVTNNLHTAYLMYLVAAANAVSNSVPDIIRCYENGIGVAENLQEAKRWTRRKIMKPLEIKAEAEWVGITKDMQSGERLDELRKRLDASKVVQIGDMIYQYGVLTNGSVCIFRVGKRGGRKGSEMVAQLSQTKPHVILEQVRDISWDLTIPETIESRPVEEIEYCAFARMTNLVSVTLPASVKVVKMFAFAGCKNLSRVSFSEGLLEIGDAAFYDCGKLRGVVLPNSVTNIGMLAFYPLPPIIAENHPHYVYEKDSLYTRDWSCLVMYYGTGTVVTVDSRAKTIASGAFYHHKSIKELLLPDGLQEIGEQSLLGCSGIRSLRIPASVTHIGNEAFQGCYGLEVVRYDGHKPNIGENIYEEYGAIVSLVKRGMGWEDAYGMLSESWPEKWAEASMVSDKRERAKTCFPLRYCDGNEDFSDAELTELYISSLIDQAEIGNVTAMSILGARYRGGWGGVKKDEKRALKYLLGSALSGNVEDMGKIGCLYRNGINGKCNYAEADKWFKRAISEGGRWSCWVCQELAPMYREGLGVEKNPEIAYLLWLVAASHGMAWAQCEVAGCYERGIGVEENVEEAKFWYGKARGWKRYEGTSQYEWRLKGAVQHAERKLREFEKGKQ